MQNDIATMKALAERLVSEASDGWSGDAVCVDAELAAKAAIALATAAAEIERMRGGVRVKALEWRAIEERRSDEDPSAEETGDFEAESPVGEYYIEAGFGSDSFVWSVSFRGDFISDWDDLDTAKAAAQADYENRIRSAMGGEHE